MSEPVYGVSVEAASRELSAPALPYRPPVPRDPGLLPIGLIGCGGISASHLGAYRAMGFRVSALASRSQEKAAARRDEFFPSAEIAMDWRALLARPEIRVVDITTHPEVRAPIIEAALNAGKHVLSQKPFACDLATARHLVAAADARGLRLAVNQNGRWAPHFAWMRAAIDTGLIGQVSSVQCTVAWDHHWIRGTAFEEVPHLVLGDFGIHWFDLVCCFFGHRNPQRVFASARRSQSQKARPAFLAQACIDFADGQAGLAFNADTRHGQEDRTTIVGSHGSLHSVGPGLLEQRVTLHTAEGVAHPELEGNWFREGFAGSMGELLCAIEDQREPINSARNNLRTLALTFAAVQSAASGSVVEIPTGHGSTA